MCLLLSTSFSIWKNAKFTQNLNKYLKLKKSPFLKYSNYSTTSICLNQATQEDNFKDKFIPFLDVINLRRQEAKRSIIVQVQSPKSCKELHSYCSLMGTVKDMLHYVCGVEPMHFVIVEFANESDVKNIIRASSFIQESGIVPVCSTFMWFKASNKKLTKLKSSKQINLLVENGNKSLDEMKIRDSLRKCNNVSEQMIMLHNLTKLDDIGVRLRFLTAKQVEISLYGLFPNAVAFPFGSSVNSYGKMNCDLDLVLRLQNENRCSEDESRLVFHSKAVNGSDRSMSIRHMEVIGDIIQLFLPGCAQVRRILQARVPIIKYYQQLADVECDLSMTNMSGVYMSDFLYLMGSIDSRVKPLIFTIRKWASEVGLTNSSPGRWITNFSLTLMVLAFLQKPLSLIPILPSLNLLVKQAGPGDKYTTEDGINCTFLRDINNIKFPNENTDDLEVVLQQFFEYYSNFDFTSKAICLNDSIPIAKPEYSPLYLVNPLERGLNVSKNVSIEELERFKVELRNAAWILQSQDKTNNWGILKLFESKKSASFPHIPSMSPRQGRLMEVSKLFEDETSDSVEYKNQHVKAQVEQIKEDTNKKLKNMENNEQTLKSLHKSWR